MNDSVKQRLIGAIVLLIICASIWPIVFPPAEQPTTVIESLIPEPPPLQIFEIPEQDDPPEITSVIQVLDEARTDLIVDTLDQPVETSALDSIEEKSTLPEPEALSDEVDTVLASDDKAWAIQMGAFSSFENAEKLAATMRAKNYSVVVQRRRHEGKELAFVFLGPYLLKSQADKLGAQLVKAGTEARVVEFQL